MKKNVKIKAVLMTIISVIILIILTINVNATTVELQNKVNTNAINTNNFTTEDISALYDEYSSQYSNEEIAQMIEQNKDEIEKKTGLKSEVISAGAEVLKSSNPEQIKDILNNDIDLNSVKEDLDSGNNVQEAINNNISTIDAIKIAVKLLYANTMFQTYLMALFILAFYRIIIRWAIYNKAGKHGWATIIPIYRDVVYYQICGISPWVILLYLLPVIGWAILLILNIVSRFRLSSAFGRGGFFGLGLWIFPAIFETILACSKKKYIGFEED